MSSFSKSLVPGGTPGGIPGGTPGGTPGIPGGTPGTPGGTPGIPGGTPGTPGGTPGTQPPSAQQQQQQQQREPREQRQPRDNHETLNSRAISEMISRQNQNFQLNNVEGHTIRVNELNIIKENAYKFPYIEHFVAQIVRNSQFSSTLPGGGEVFYIPQEIYQVLKPQLQPLKSTMVSILNPPEEIKYSDLAEVHIGKMVSSDITKKYDTPSADREKLLKELQKKEAEEAKERKALEDKYYINTVAIVIPTGIKNDGHITNSKYPDSMKSVALSPQYPLDLTVSPICFVEKILVRFLSYYIGDNLCKCDDDIIEDTTTNHGYIKLKKLTNGTYDLDSTITLTEVPAGTPPKDKSNFDFLVKLIRRGLNVIVNANLATINKANFYPITKPDPTAPQGSGLMTKQEIFNQLYYPVQQGNDYHDPLTSTFIDSLEHTWKNGIHHYQFHTIESLYQSLKLLLIPMISILPYLMRPDGTTNATNISTADLDFINDTDIKKLVRGFQSISAKGLQGLNDDDSIKSALDVDDVKFNEIFNKIVNNAVLKTKEMNVWDWIITGRDENITIDDYLKNLKNKDTFVDEVSKLSKQSLLYDLVMLQYYSSDSFRKAVNDYKTTKNKNVMFLLNLEGSSLDEPYWKGFKSDSEDKIPYYSVILHLFHEDYSASNLHQKLSESHIKIYTNYSPSIFDAFYQNVIQETTKESSLKSGVRTDTIESKNFDDVDDTEKNRINFTYSLDKKDQNTYIKGNANIKSIKSYDPKNLLTNDDNYFKTSLNNPDVLIKAKAKFTDTFGNLPSLFYVPDCPFILFFEETPDSYQIHFYCTDDMEGKVLAKDELNWGVRLKFNKDIPALAGNLGIKYHPHKNIRDGITLESYKPLSTIGLDENLFNSFDSQAVHVSIPSNVISVFDSYDKLNDDEHPSNISNNSLLLKESSHNKNIINSLTFLKNSYDKYIMSIVYKSQGFNILSNYIKNNTRRLYDESIDKSMLIKLVSQDVIKVDKKNLNIHKYGLSSMIIMYLYNINIYDDVNRYINPINDDDSLKLLPYKLYMGLITATMVIPTIRRPMAMARLLSSQNKKTDNTNYKSAGFNREYLFFLTNTDPNTQVDADVIDFVPNETPASFNVTQQENCEFKPHNDVNFNTAPDVDTLFMNLNDITKVSGNVSLLRNCVRAIRDWYINVCGGK
jgi:hypothetical protein